MRGWGATLGANFCQIYYWRKKSALPQIACLPTLCCHSCKRRRILSLHSTMHPWGWCCSNIHHPSYHCHQNQHQFHPQGFGRKKLFSSLSMLLSSSSSSASQSAPASSSLGRWFEVQLSKKLGKKRESCLRWQRGQPSYHQHLFSSSSKTLSSDRM